MLSAVKSALHRHRFEYRTASGSRSDAGEYTRRLRFVTRRCGCGASNHNVGYSAGSAPLV